ncbi:hypothetical protein Tco_1247321 [Tanacetum coccineum]
MEHARKQQVPKETITSSDTTALEQFDQKTTLHQKITNSKSFNRSPKQRALYHVVMESILKDEDAIAESRGLKRRKTSKDTKPSKKAKSTGTSKGTHVELKYNIKECYKAVTDRLDWNNHEGKEYPFNLSKPLPLIIVQGRQVVPIYYFINNDLEYLRGGSSSKKYTTSITKTKAAKYDILGIEDMVPSLWIPVKWYDYGYLEEFDVRREDQQLYKFKEGDFPRLHLHDIKDMLLLLDQKKLSNFKRDVIFDLGVALQMFTDVLFDISKRVTYTAYINPQGIIYEDKYKRNRLMCKDELYKFSDGTLTSVRTVLHDIASNPRMDYLPKRKWSNLNRQRSHIMIKAIHKLLLERRLMRSLEKFVGGRDYQEDLRLLEQTI